MDEPAPIRESNFLNASHEAEGMRMASSVSGETSEIDAGQSAGTRSGSSSHNYEGGGSPRGGAPGGLGIATHAPDSTPDSSASPPKQDSQPVTPPSRDGLPPEWITDETVPALTVPEPGTWLMLLMGLVGLRGRRRDAAPRKS